MMTLPLPFSFLTRNSASLRPNSRWSVSTFSALGVVTILSNETTRMPRPAAWLMMPFSPVGEAAFTTIALTRSAIRLDICCDCLLTSLPELYHEPATCDLYGLICSADLNRFSISMRHLLPMNELESAILCLASANAGAPRAPSNPAPATPAPAYRKPRRFREMVMVLFPPSVGLSRGWRRAAHHAFGRLTVNRPAHGVPCSAASRQSRTTGCGLVSVKSG